MFRLSKVLAFGVSATVVAAGLMFFGPSPSADAVPATVPLTIKNTSGRSEARRMVSTAARNSAGPAAAALLGWVS